jgi:predicted ATPase
MIQSLHISGFKLFREITLPKLGRLNLFVGENNTGKSCLLEAIGLYAGRSPVADILETASRRSTGRVRPWIAEGMNEESSSLRHPVFDLFHWVGSGFTPPIVIEKIGDSRPLRVEFQLHQRITDDQGLVRYVPVSPGDVVAEQTEIALPVYRGDRQVALITRRALPLRGRGVDTEKVLNGDAFAVAHLPAGGFTDEKAASMWDLIVQGPGQGMVLDWLRMLEPRVEDLAYIGDEGFQRKRVALLKVEGEGRIPLRSMGDGLTRLFHVGLAMASASKGILLIDEFENGLHWKVQEKLWGVLSKAARKFDVQIFATTHSRDCIGSFAAAGRELSGDDAIIYRLERTGKSDNVYFLKLPLINVDAAMREDMEVR